MKIVLKKAIFKLYYITCLNILFIIIEKKSNRDLNVCEQNKKSCYE